VKSHGVEESMGNREPEGRVVQIPPPLFFGFEKISINYKVVSKRKVYKVLY